MESLLRHLRYAPSVLIDIFEQGHFELGALFPNRRSAAETTQPSEGGRFLLRAEILKR